MCYMYNVLLYTCTSSIYILINKTVLSFAFHVQTLRLRPSPQLKAEFSNPSAGFHSTQSVAAVAMSKFDEKSPLPYEKLVERLAVVKSRLGRPLTLSEKVLYSHLDDPKGQGRCIEEFSFI